MSFSSLSHSFRYQPLCSSPDTFRYLAVVLKLAWPRCSCRSRNPSPESFTFTELVQAIARATGTRVHPVHLPPAVVTVLLRGLSLLTRDVVLTRDEIDGLMAELIHVEGPATCPTRLTDYLHANAASVGRHYASELSRRRPVTPVPHRSPPAP